MHELKAPPLPPNTARDNVFRDSYWLHDLQVDRQIRIGDRFLYPVNDIRSILPFFCYSIILHEKKKKE